MEVKGSKKRVNSQADIKAPVNLDGDLFGNPLKVPAHIMAELQKKELAHRFISTKTLQASGGYHPKGWVPYKIDNPQVNPLTGTADGYHRVGDLILAVKPKSEHAKHLAWLKQKADAMKKSNKNTVQDMRDRIRDSGASKHVSLIEGYEENGDDE